MSTNSNVIILSAKLKRPSVRILKGRVSVAKIGFTKAFKNPSTIPQKIRIVVEPVKEAPTKRRSESQSTIIEARECVKKSLNIFSKIADKKIKSKCENCEK